MLSSNCKRGDDSSNSSSSSSSSNASGNLRLPNELQAKIIELACRMPSIKKDPYPDLTKLRDARRPPRTLLDLDLETTLDLTTVCQSIYPHAARVLYSHIRVTRPSSLQLLHRSLVERPSSGLHIKSLHIGPTDRNPYRRWWPIEPAWADHGLEEYGCGTATLSDSSWTLEDELRMPQWYGSGSWPISPTRSPPDCRGISVVEAIKAAQRFIDVDLEVSPCNFARQNIGMSTWTMRVFEVQAALDLYLVAMRRCEEESRDYQGSWRSVRPDSEAHPDAPLACRKGSCGHYPALRLTGYPPPPDHVDMHSNRAQSPLIVSREQILDYIRRRGAHTDRFDHVLLFLQSGADYNDLETHGRAGSNGGHEERLRPTVSLEAEAIQFDTAAPEHDARLAKTDPATVSGLLILARSVLAFATNVTNLSLTGFLVRAACSRHRPPSLPRLTSLALGPTPPHWRSGLRLDHPALVQVKHLRLAGMALLEEEVRTIAKDLVGLEKLQWIMSCQFSSLHPVSLTAILNGLSGTDAIFGDDESSTAAAGLRSQLAYEEGTVLDVEGQPSIEVQLHAHDLAAVLAQARSEKVREALQRGGVLPGMAPRRLMLVESSAASGWRKGSTLHGHGIDSGWDQLYKDGWQWWLDQARL